MSWQEIRLGSAIHIKHGYAFKSQYFAESGKYIVLTPGNFKEEGGFRLRPGKDRSYAGTFPEDFVLSEGDLIIAMTEQGPGLLGSSALIPEPGRFLHNQRLGLVDRLDSSKLGKHFLYYLFNTRSVRAQISGSASGTKVHHTAPERIYRVCVRVPEVHEQERIADTLSAYDDLIENNRRRIHLLEQAAQMLYKEWFVYLRFPGHEHARIVDGVPEGWERRRLGEVSTVNRASLGKAYQGEIEYIDISSVTPGCIDGTIIYRFEDAPSRARRIVQHGDIIWSCVRPNRKSCAVIWMPADNLIASTGFAVITPTKLCTSYLYQVLTTDEFVGYLTNNARGVAYPAVTSSDFEKSVIQVPPNYLVQQFDEIVQPMLIQKCVLEEGNRKLLKARDLLLPRLMNGEIAV